MNPPVWLACSALAAEVGHLLPQMTHCRRCRADAVGLLCGDRSGELGGVLAACGKLPPQGQDDRPHIAVATREGMLINQHLGEAKRFQIWGRDGLGGFRLVEERQAPPQGCGPSRWEELARLLSDCRAVLVGAVGETPRRILSGSGAVPVACSGFIEDALRTVGLYADLTEFGARFTNRLWREAGTVRQGMLWFPPRLLEEARLQHAEHRGKFALQGTGLHKAEGFADKVGRAPFLSPGDRELQGSAEDGAVEGGS